MAVLAKLRPRIWVDLRPGEGWIGAFCRNMAVVVKTNGTVPFRGRCTTHLVFV